MKLSRLASTTVRNHTSPRPSTLAKRFETASQAAKLLHGATAGTSNERPQAQPSIGEAPGQLGAVQNSSEVIKLELARALRPHGQIGRECAVAISSNGAFDPKAFLASIGEGRWITKWRDGDVLFSQCDPADSLFYIQKGKVKVIMLSSHGKEAVVAILNAGDFFGEGCLAGQPLRISTVAALVDSSIARLQKAAVIRLLHDQPAFSELFMTYLLARNIRMEADLIDQLFNSSEKRLARLLLLLANFGKDGSPQPVVAKISQETLAEMIGTTRSRVSSFMNKFRRMGFIEYNGHLEVHSSLLSVVLHDDSRSVSGSDVSSFELVGG